MSLERARRLLREAGGERWDVTPDAFAATLDRSAAKAFAGRSPGDAELERYLSSLHLADLALACACLEGRDEAWDHFVLEFRPILYRAADALDPRGGAREVADALHGELFSRSLFKYFHGRSSLATWLRSLVSQRYVDRFRQTRRLDPLPEDSSAAALPSPERPANPDRARFVTAMRAVLGAAIAALAPRDRLRLGCYYAEEMTLAQIGRLTGEHEATVSRSLARTRKAIREDVERRLRSEQGFSEPEVAECFASIADDAGDLDMAEWLKASKNPAVDRSTSEDAS
jgi:RNA polymerase sigma factor (sigma-70 family)